jgi:multidrug efflux pump subunit AcrA (membrane-fusion protein)
MDPTSLRFEGLVSADAVDEVKVGQAVSFRVNGYGVQEFVGSVRRINPAANPTTRQLEVLVDFSQGQQPQLAGLYAEGQIQAARKPALMVPAVALVRDGDSAYAWRVKDGLVQKVTLVLGERDARSGDFVLRSGLSAGEQLIRNPTSALKDGQKVQVAAAATAAKAAASAPAAAASAAGK